MILQLIGFILVVLSSAWLLHMIEPGERPTRRTAVAVVLILALVLGGMLESEGESGKPLCVGVAAPVIMPERAA